MIHIVPLEPLEERYTAQWQRWIPHTLSKMGVEYREIPGVKLTDKIETGSVLDAHGTSHWKTTQMTYLIYSLYHGMIKDGDVIWFADLWFPGIEHLAYIRDLTGVNFKIKGVLHAGSWDADDFINRTGIHKWCRGFEQTLFDIVDEVHLGTEFHRNLILAQGWCEPSKLKVTGLFFDAKEVSGRRLERFQKDPNLVVFCQRLDPEKKPEKFDELKAMMEGTDFKFVRTRDLNLSKNDYYDLLATASYAVSFDGQETFGYTVLECMSLGVTPLVANAKAYRETVPEQFRWDTMEELKAKLTTRVHGTPEELFKYANKYSPQQVCSNMFL